MADLIMVQAALDKQAVVIEALTQGVTLMNETLDGHGEMLSRIMQALSAEEQGESPIVDLMLQQLAMLREIKDMLGRQERRAGAQRYSISPEVEPERVS